MGFQRDASLWQVLEGRALEVFTQGAVSLIAKALGTMSQGFGAAQQLPH